MEPALIPVVVATGAVVGFSTSLLPGFHVNTLAAFVLAATAVGVAHPWLALALVAAFAAGQFAAPVVGTFLGAPDEASAAVALPAHVLLKDGRGAEAADLAALGTFMGIALGLGIAALLRPVLGTPWHGYALVERAMPWLLLIVVGVLLATERRRVPHRRAFRVTPLGDARVEGVVTRGRDPDAPPHLRRASGRRVRLVDPAGLLDASPDGTHARLTGEWTWTPGPFSRACGVGLAVVVFTLAGALGWVALNAGARSPFGFPASPLLPLLAGLFGAPPLADAARRPRAIVPPQVAGRARAAWSRVGGAVTAGTLPGALIGLLPGLSPAHAGAIGLAARRHAGTEGERDPETTLLVLGAANGAAVAFSLFAFTTLDRPRSGALLAAGAVTVARPWLPYAGAALAAGAVAYFLAAWTARALARGVNRVPERAVAIAVLALLAASTFAFTGWTGLLQLATAAAIGTLPLRWGVRRSHAMGVVLLPVLLWRWG